VTIQVSGRFRIRLAPSDLAWIALGVGVVGYDVLAGPGETMSEGADRYMLRHPWLVRGVAFALAAHVCNVVPDRLDAVHQLFEAMRRVGR
jgi:hypothetical protein